MVKIKGKRVCKAGCALFAWLCAFAHRAHFFTAVHVSNSAIRKCLQSIMVGCALLHGRASCEPTLKDYLFKNCTSFWEGSLAGLFWEQLGLTLPRVIPLGENHIRISDRINCRRINSIADLMISSFLFSLQFQVSLFIC